MSKGLVSRFVLSGLLIAGAVSGCFALANGDVLSALDGTSLAVSETPALLGPIDEHGRIGWACPPERAAESKNAAMAELPQAPK